ncbi:hypothetical protein CXB51_028031 [Gossypium anomalum]|uniref:RNase H type-1 domain-containing protein n=1 Tax=Gossypium anomalum TaxID=47600 RepID=A0A8J5XXG6_9ROSI|nr:hypothetical protein CXB51_028031 [Gossypium anomalum]
MHFLNITLFYNSKSELLKSNKYNEYERVRKNLAVTNGCLLHGGGQETILHVFRDFSFATKVWRMQITSSPKEIIGRADCFVANIREAMTKGNLVNGRREEGFKWSSPSHGWEKINVDGSTSTVDNWSAVGGKEGFRKKLGRCSIFNVELWAILCGLEVARLRNYRKVIVESDCLVAMECRTDKSGDSHLMILVRKITAVNRCFQMVKF